MTHSTLEQIAAAISDLAGAIMMELPPNWEQLDREVLVDMLLYTYSDGGDPETIELQRNLISLAIDEIEKRRSIRFGTD